MTDLILGMGEVGSAIFGLLEGRGYSCSGIDADTSRNRGDFDASSADFLHVCIPGDLEEFQEVSLRYAAACCPKAILVHSTVRPGTVAALQAKADIPIISAPTRGVHHRFIPDMQRYTKFMACDQTLDPSIISDVEKRFIKVTWMSNTKTLELAKILTDTTYYGWLINYAQITAMICQKEKIDYDEMWTFADEIHQYLGNRPKMFPGVIGGHCVIPNLSLIDYDDLQAVRTINDMYGGYLKRQSTKQQDAHP